MHVVEALVALNLGGSELVATELAEYLQAEGHRVTVLAAAGPLAPRVHAAGAQHLDWPIGRKRPSTLALVPRLANWMRRERPDLVHVHSRLPAWICRLALNRLPPAERPAFVTSVHGHYSVNRYSAVMVSGDRVIAVSQAIRAYILRNYPMAAADRVVTVPGGTDPATFPHGHRPKESWYQATWAEFPELRGKRLLCLPGRLARYKGHGVFIELLSVLAAEFPDVHGIVVGTARPGSRYRNELEGLAERSRVLNRITFTGARQDMRDWLAASSLVFSLCSDPPEAFGRTVCEALHLGIPVIGWDHGGVREILAALFPPGAVTPDDPMALLARTRAFLRDPPRVPASSALGLEDSLRATTAIYRELLAQRPTETHP